MATRKQLAWRKKFGEMAKAGKFRKKKKTAKRNPRKKVAAKKTTTKRRIRPAPIRSAKKSNVIRRKAAGRTLPATQSQARALKTKKVKRNPSQFAIQGVKPTKSGYEFYYLKGDRFVKTIGAAQKWRTRPACHLKMREVLKKLPFAIREIRCVKV